MTKDALLLGAHSCLVTIHLYLVKHKQPVIENSVTPSATKEHADLVLEVIATSIHNVSMVIANITKLVTEVSVNASYLRLTNLYPNLQQTDTKTAKSGMKVGWK
jgi:hypothetical protein